MKTTIPRSSKKILLVLKELKKGLEQYYTNRLLQLILFGSYARGTPHEESDIDILIILSDLTSYKEESDKIFDFKYNLSLKNDIYISLHFTTHKKFNNMEELLYYNVKKEGIVI